MSLRFTEVDDLIRHQHSRLRPTDRCWFLREYIAQGGYGAGDTNNWISNLKKPVDTDQGLTKTHNVLKDSACTEPRILELRRLHGAMDRAVLDAYTWTDIGVPPYCALTDADRQALQAFRGRGHRSTLCPERAARGGRGAGNAAGKGKRARAPKDDGPAKANRAKQQAKAQRKLFE